MYEKHYSPVCVVYSKTIYSHSASFYNYRPVSIHKNTIHLSVWHILKQFILPVPLFYN